MVSVEKKIKILKFVQIIQRSAFLAGEKNKLKNRYEKKNWRNTLLKMLLIQY